MERQEIAEKDADSLARRIGAKFHVQVSAKTNDNIEKMFRDMGLQLIAADSEVRPIPDNLLCYTG